MQSNLTILMLLGKKADKAHLTSLMGEPTTEIADYSVISRGVRKLESCTADIVVLVPDPEDTSLSRAIQRIRDEYGKWSVVIGDGNTDMETQAMEAGAYEYFDLSGLTAKSVQKTFTHIKRQLELEKALEKNRVRLAWLEKTGRLGAWEVDKDGVFLPSDGMRRILADNGQVTTDFNSIRQFVHPDDLETFDQANKATFDQGWPLDFEYRVIDANNQLHHLHLRRNVEYGDDGKVIRTYGMCRDVTPEREFEEFLFRRDAILQVAGNFAKDFLRESDWLGGLTEALAALGRAAEVSRAFVFRTNGKRLEDVRFSMTHEWTEKNLEPLIGNPMVQNQTFSPVFDRWKVILNSHKIVAGNTREFQSTERAFFDQLSTKSILLVPVFAGDSWWGFIGLTEARKEREWMPNEIEPITMVADMFGAAILRSRMVSQLKEANRAAELAHTEAVEASKTKSRFLANMSHEIRTPISGVLGMAEMLVTTGLTTEQREHMDMIRDAARSLLGIVNDLLDISKIEADKLEFKKEDFELRPMLEAILRSFAPMVAKKPLSLNHAVSRDVPALVHGDPDRLGQVLRNLVGNALKFTERGHVDVSVTTTETKNGQVCLLFKVEDSGEGIPDDLKDAIFDAFTQADSSAGKKYQGTGLGLAISRELVRMMDGEIGVVSQIGLGSSFSFTVWLGKPEQKVKKEVSKKPLIPQGMHLNILMVEDNPLNQKFLSHFLGMFGHNVTIAGNGVEGLRKLEELGRNIDLILMDIQMPEMGGMEATKIIRKSDGRAYDPTIPIIALTAYAMKGDKERMFDAGMNDYVSKPVDMQELSGAIARAVSDRPTSSTPRNGTNKKPAPSVELDMNSLKERFDGNMELLAEILELFLKESETKLIKLEQAIAASDTEEVGAAIHSITNISSHVLAMDIVNKARELERRVYREPLEDVLPGINELRPQFKALVKAVREEADTL